MQRPVDRFHHGGNARWIIRLDARKKFSPIGRGRRFSSRELCGTIGPAGRVLAAVRIMEEKNIGFLVVLEKEAITGVMSERDCLRRVSKQWAFVVELIRCKRGSERSLQLS